MADAPDPGAEARPLPWLSDCLDTEEFLLFELASCLSLREIEVVGKAYVRANYPVPVVTKSPAGRRLGVIADKLVAQVNERDLAALKVAAVTADGTPVGEKEKHTMMIVVVVTTDGVKVPVAIGEGPTETKALVKGTLADVLGRRHLNARYALWLTDGGDGLLGAIDELTEGQAQMQRCVVHVARKVVQRHLTVADRVAIGRRLVDEPHEHRAVTEERLQKLAALRAAIAADPKDKKAQSDEQELLREIGEVAVRGGLYRAWDKPDVAVAEGWLLGEAKWLEEQGYKSAANAIRAAIDGTLTLQKLGLAIDEELRRLMRTTNAVESLNKTVKSLVKRVNLWLDNGMRQRYVALGVAHAELSWHLMAEQRQLEWLTLKVMGSYHPAIAFQIGQSEDLASVRLGGLKLIEGIDPDGHGGERVDAALAELAQWADVYDKTVVVEERALDRVPDPDARRRALADLGFEAAGERGTMIRMPAGTPDPALALDAVAAEIRDPATALALLGAAIGDQPRLLAAVAERAHVHMEALVEAPVEHLEHEAAAGLMRAHRELAAVRSEVDAWWIFGRQAAYRQLGVRLARAEREGRPPPADLIGPGRAAVMHPHQVDGLRARAAAAAAVELRGVPESRLDTYERHLADAFAPVDAAVERVDAAARAVAATHLLAAHAQIVEARRRVAERDGPAPELPAPPPEHDERHLPPIDRHRSALGPSAEALSRGAAALERLVEKEDVAVVLELQAGTQNPWRHFDGAAALRTRKVEERDVEDLVKDYGAALTARLEREAEAEAGAKHAGRVEPAAQKADAAWKDVSAARSELADLRTRPGSLDRFLVEQPHAALHHAVTADVHRRALAVERTAELPGVEHAVQPAALDVGV